MITIKKIRQQHHSRSLDKIVVFGEGNDRYDIPKSEIQTTGRNVLIGLNLYEIANKYKANSMITVIKNGINPILNRYNYPELSVKMGIDEGDNLIVQYGHDKSSLIDIVRV